MGALPELAALLLWFNPLLIPLMLEAMLLVPALL